MDEKLPRDESGEILQDDLTENQTKLDGPERDDIEHDKAMDPGVDSQEDDRAMEENIFGVNQPKKK